PGGRRRVGGAGAPWAGGAYASAPGQRGLAGAWREQPPLYAASRTGQPAPPGTPRPPAARPQPGRGGRKRGRSRTRRVLLIVGIVGPVLLVVVGAPYFYLHPPAH